VAVRGVSRPAAGARARAAADAAGRTPAVVTNTRGSPFGTFI